MSYSQPPAASVYFDFTGAYSSPQPGAVSFNFGDDAALAAITQPPSVAFIAEHDGGIDGLIAATTTAPQVVASGEFHLVVIAGVDATADAPLAVLNIEWGERVPAPPSIAVDSTGGIRWGRADAADKSADLPFNDSPAKQARVAATWERAAEKQSGTDALFGTIPVRESGVQAHWSRFAQWISPDIEAAINYAPPFDINLQLLWDEFDLSIDCDQSDPWHYSPPMDVTSDYAYQRVERWGSKQTWSTAGYVPPPAGALEFSFQGVYLVPAWDAADFSWGGESPYGNQPVRPTDPGVSVAHDAPPTIDKDWRVTWGNGSWTRPLPDYIWSPSWNVQPEQEAPRPAQPQIREVYIFMPVLTLYRTPDGAEIDATNVTWTTDSDSWGWRFNATIKKESDLALLKPDSNGPREIACEINGHIFKGIVESYGRSRQFSQTGITIKGRSLSGMLSDPYAPKRSKAIEAPYTVIQLAEQELAATGWTVDWQAQDWLIPSGAFGYHDMDPMAVIKRLAGTVGAIVQSHPSNKQLIVKPRYPVSPHKWTDPGTTLDAILPAALIQQSGSEFKTLPSYNRAIAAGGASGGVIVTLTRDGTAGDELAPVVTDDLITHQDAGYERARVEIAKGGSWEMMSFTTWLTDLGQSPGLMLPGHLVEIQDTDETYPVQISSTTINAQSTDQSLKVRQQLTAERTINV